MYNWAARLSMHQLNYKNTEEMMWEEAQQICCNRMLMNLAMNKPYFFRIQTGYGKCRSLLHSFAFNERVRRSMHSQNINRKVYNLFIHSGNLICWRFHKRFHHITFNSNGFFWCADIFLQKNSEYILWKHNCKFALVNITCTDHYKNVSTARNEFEYRQPINWIDYKNNSYVYIWSKKSCIHSCMSAIKASQ